MYHIRIWICCCKCTVSLIHHTQEFMESEGIVLNDPELMPVDPYGKCRKNPPPSYTTPSELDRMHQFLTMDRKVKEIPSIPNSLGNHYKPKYGQLLTEKQAYNNISSSLNLFLVRCCVSLPCGTMLTLCTGRPGLLPSSISWWMIR